MSLTTIISKAAGITAKGTSSFLGRLYWNDRDAYYETAGKRLGGWKDFAFDYVGAAYTYSHIALWWNYANSGDSGDFQNLMMLSIVRVAAPFACKKIADTLMGSKKVWEYGVQRARPHGLGTGEYAIAKGLFEELKQQANGLYNQTHYLAATQRLLDFPQELMKTLQHKK